jgi:hypothetical protein
MYSVASFSLGRGWFQGLRSFDLPLDSPGLTPDHGLVFIDHHAGEGPFGLIDVAGLGIDHRHLVGQAGAAKVGGQVGDVL